MAGRVAPKTLCDMPSSIVSKVAVLDGREFLQGRPHDLSFGPELGYVECSLGKTRLRTTRGSERVVTLLPKTCY